MRVNADLINGYKFQLDKSDFNYMPSGFKSLLTPVDGGEAFKSQALVSEILFIGIPFTNVAGVLVPATKTYRPKTKFAALTDHEMTTSAEFGSVISKAAASMPKSYQWIKASGKMFYANHVPQLHQGFGGSFISGVNGDFDWKTKSFVGSIYVGGDQ